MEDGDLLPWSDGFPSQFGSKLDSRARVYRGIAEILENYGASVVSQILNEVADQLESRDGAAYLQAWLRLEKYLEGD